MTKPIIQPIVDISQLEPRFERTPSCWIWKGSRSVAGYGYVRSGSRNTCAHRVVYELLVGPIPEGLVIDHLCRNPSCVNPAHLEPVTQAENILRGLGPVAANAKKTECVHGHSFDEANTYVDSNGGRKCRTCRAAMERQRRKRLVIERVIDSGEFELVANEPEMAG